MVVLVDVEAVCHRNRLMLRVYCCTGVSLLVRIVPIRPVSQELKVYLSGLELCLLQAEEVRIQLSEDVCESFAAHGSEAVYIP